MQLSFRVVVTEVQRTYTDPAAAGGRPAQDDKLLPLVAFDLDPGPSAAASVWSIRPFADDPLKVHAAGVPEHDRRLADRVVAEAKHSRPFRQPAQQTFAVELAASS